MSEVTMKKARQMVEECIDIYLAKDESGQYMMKQQKQRPIFLEGPAGIGKTELAARIAEERKLGFVSYSLTHHTRQSAVGLPSIVTRRYEGRDYEATEYTMSEIVDSIYSAIREGHREGILFLDEVNCVSETLSAVLLAFLQNKCFGPHRIPEGWIIMTAGNPGEYNRSVHEFDAVTCDRLRFIKIRPDLESWLEYARERGVHPIVINYVEKHPAAFYLYERKGREMELVTARGWEDVSNAVRACENFGYEVDEPMISQFIRKESVALDFVNYYSLFKEMLGNKTMEAIFQGKCRGNEAEPFRHCDFQRKWAVTLVLLSETEAEAESVYRSWKQYQTKEQQETGLVKWQERLTNSLLFLEEAFGKECELEHYLSMLCRCRHTGVLLAARKNAKFHQLYEEMAEGRETKQSLAKAMERLEAKEGDKPC